MYSAVSPTLGFVELSELVFETDHSKIWFDVPLLENTANELKKNSVPPCAPA